MEVTGKIEGLADLERNLRALPETIAKKVLVSAGRAGIAVFRKAVLASARATFQEHSGRLFRGIRVAFRIRGLGVKGALVQFWTGLSTRGKDSPFYGRFWERGFRHIGRGAKNRRALRAGKTSGKFLRRKFFESAFDAGKSAALDAFVSKAQSEFERLRGPRG